MSRSFEAIYRNGVITPLEPVELLDNQKLIVSVSDSDQAETDPADVYPAFAEAVRDEIDAPGMELYDANRVGS